jgi:type I restriction enzyme R subunit
MLSAAARPLATNPALRSEIMATRQRYEQTIDHISKDQVLFAGFDASATERARETVASFEEFIKDNKDEITALQVLYSRPYAQRLTFVEIRALADALRAPPRSWLPDDLWRAYETLDESRVRDAGGKRILTDIVSLVRFALGQESALSPFAEQVEERFSGWLAVQETTGRTFTAEQRAWLEAIRDAIASGFEVTKDDFESGQLLQLGGLGKAHAVFGRDLDKLLNELNEALVA